MSALAEALLAAQRQAIAALAKSYVGGVIDEPALLEELDRIGCKDAVDQGLFVDTLAVVKNYGGEAPKPTGGHSVKMPDEPTQAQRSFIAKLCKEKSVPEPDVVVSKEQAHEIIDALKAGTYSADKYTVPF